MNFGSITLNVLALTAVATVLSACGKKEQAAAPAAPASAALVVKIGHVGPISGAIAHLGKDNEMGARMAIDELNAAGDHRPTKSYPGADGRG